MANDSNVDNLKTGFIVRERPELIEWLKSHSISESDYQFIPIVLTSDILCQPLKPGSVIFIHQDLKAFFIQHELPILVFGRENIEKIFGSFECESELFDRFWKLDEVLCVDVPIKHEVEN
ncbi:hypothetical protein [Hahella sp. HN01]|uniref:hypothetical protein n=1 Tax=Hahella sp. HN01 TaxID=2847262 RepID=UPI001C1EF028|nr:hypothetical protein [Hahella sp. HN01]MBU6950129.1 hypothetical protein [Hahella sp. HN01]